MAVDSSRDIHVLPEDCLSKAISLTSPKDACRLSAVATTFRSASQSDVVWERFLPSDYRSIVSRHVEGADSLLRRFGTKKELYLYLCDHPILIDGGAKTFSLEKLSGKKCYMISARDLSIVWGDTNRYWQWIHIPNSRFSEVAELLNVCWFEIKANMNTSELSPSTKYAAHLVFATKSRIYGFEHQQVDTIISINGEEVEKKSVCLDPEGAERQRYQIVPRRIGLFYHRFIRQQEINSLPQACEYPKQRGDGWFEVELGEFFVDEGGEGELQVCLMEVRTGDWKSGLIIEGIEVRPKAC